MKKAIAFLLKYPFFLFLLFLIFAYLPVFLPFFHLKNDLVTQNLPTRFVISESLYSGYFPWWNPYIYYGIPQYGDMNNGFWNPFIWIISKTVGYNIWTITLEEMLYILLGGWGIYKTCREICSKESSLLTGLAYMASGYIVGHLQHFCWITGTAFFPYVLLFFIRINKNPVVKNFIGGAFAVCIFLAATHPGLIIGALYFFLFAIIFIFLFRKNYSAVLYGKKFWRINILFLVLSALVSCVVIASNAETLQYISRGLKLSKEQMLLNPTSFQSYISLLVPLAVHKSAFFQTDISMRNSYAGIAGLLGFLLFIKYQPRKITIALCIALFFFVLLAAGGYFKIFFSRFIPLAGYVRMNGEFTYFAVLILLLAGAGGIDHFFSQRGATGFLQKLLSVLAWVFCTGIIIALLYIIVLKEGAILAGIPLKTGSVKEIMKYLVDNLSVYYLLLAGSILQLITVLLLKKFLFNRPVAAIILAVNLIIITWLILPYTGLGTRSRKEFDRQVTIFEKGIHAPELKSINNTAYLDSSLFDDVQLISSYSKKIGYKKEETYPVQLRSSRSFYDDLPLQEFINRQSYIFLSTDTIINASTAYDSTRIHILAFGPGYMKASVANDNYGYITFLQNNYPHWNVAIDGQKTDHFTAYKTFISIAFPKGVHVIEFYFNPRPIRFALWISLFFIFSGCIVLLNKQLGNKSLF